MKAATKRSTLRGIHLIFTIPVLGYVYGKPAEVEQYAAAARLVFVPVILLTGYWMYSGLLFAIIGAGLWLGVNRFFGSGAAILSQMALFVGWNIWLWGRKKQSRGSVAA